MPFITDDPTRKTSGLTSATQIVDVTDWTTFSDKNTTSSMDTTITFRFVEEHTLETLKPNLETQRFKEILKKTVAKDISILKELSKY